MNLSLAGYLLFALVNDREDDFRFVKIAVYGETEFTALQGGETLGDGKSETAAFGGSGYITANKTFGKFFRTNIERGCGNIFNGEDGMIIDIFKKNSRRSACCKKIYFKQFK